MARSKKEPKTRPPQIALWVTPEIKKRVRDAKPEEWKVGSWERHVVERGLEAIAAQS